MMETGAWIGFVFPSVIAIVFVIVVIAGRINMWWTKRLEDKDSRQAFDLRQESIGELLVKYRFMVAPLPHIAEKIDARIRQLVSWIDQETELLQDSEIHLLHPVQEDLMELLEHATTSKRGETPVEFRSRMMEYLEENKAADGASSYPDQETEPEPELEPEPEPDPYMSTVAKPPEFRRPKADEDNTVTVGDLGVKVDSSLVEMWEKSGTSKGKENNR